MMKKVEVVKVECSIAVVVKCEPENSVTTQ